MNNKLRMQICENTNLVENPKNILSGMVNGYYVTMDMREQQVCTMHINANLPAGMDATGVNQYLGQLKAENKLISATYEDASVIVKCNVFGGHAGEKIRTYMNSIIGYLQHIGAITGCAVCGDPLKQLGLYDMHGAVKISCDGCFEEKLNTVAQHQVAYKKKRGNAITGLVGGLLGGLIGVIVWCAIYKLGYVAAISGIIMVVAVMKGYELFGGKINIFGAIATMVISLALIYFAEVTAVSFDIVDGFKEIGMEVSFWDVFRNFTSIVNELEDGWSSIIHDLMYGAIFTIVGGIGIVYSTYKEKAGLYSMKKIG